MNSTLLGGGVRHELQKAYVKGETDTDLCVGGCEKWNKSDAGINRYDSLKKRWEEHAERTP